ncbi:uncharacterized protein [Oscarella lobularis]|uniref:uncharacterized protein n=1 Tax=Oscarella lobularis TaxID=121494 RepID=UPI003313354F
MSHFDSNFRQKTMSQFQLQFPKLGSRTKEQKIVKMNPKDATDHEKKSSASSSSSSVSSSRPKDNSFEFSKEMNRLDEFEKQVDHLHDFFVKCRLDLHMLNVDLLSAIHPSDLERAKKRKGEDYYHTA